MFACKIWFLLVVLWGATSADGTIALPVKSYKILMLLPFASKSHMNVFRPLIDSLASRGHKVVILSPLHSGFGHSNIKEIDHGVRVLDENQDMFTSRNDPAGAFGMFKDILPRLAKEMYKVPQVKQLFSQRDKFDLIVINAMFNEVAYPFAAGRKFIGVSTTGQHPVISAVLGNVLNPSYAPALILESPRPYSLINRFRNIASNLFTSIYWRHWAIVPLIQKEISAQFPDLPPLLEIERNMSLVLENTHFSLDTPKPLVPAEIEIGGMHCRPAQPLPKNLREWINGAESDGVIYFSLGSVAKGVTMPEVYRNLFIEAFKKVKQRVIWKYEGELKGISDNILVDKWMPQQDILAHPNVKVFITHGGLLSIQEALYHKTPMLAVPIFGDQPKNGQKIENSGFGKVLIWEELTVDLIVDSLQEIINNEKYIETVTAASAAFRDQPMSPVDRAVWWTEYVIRHDGAPHLHSPGADLSWIEYLMIDFIIAIHLAVFITFWIIRKCFSLLCSRRSEKKKSKKE